MLTEQRQATGAPELTAQPVERFEDRHVGFTGTVLFETLPLRDPGTTVEDDLLLKRFYHRRLSGSQFTCHKDDLALSLLGFC